MRRAHDDDYPRKVDIVYSRDEPEEKYDPRDTEVVEHPEKVVYREVPVDVDDPDVDRVVYHTSDPPDRVVYTTRDDPNVVYRTGEVPTERVVIREPDDPEKVVYRTTEVPTERVVYKNPNEPERTVYRTSDVPRERVVYKPPPDDKEVVVHTTDVYNPKHDEKVVYVGGDVPKERKVVYDAPRTTTVETRVPKEKVVYSERDPEYVRVDRHKRTTEVHKYIDEHPSESKGCKLCFWDNWKCLLALLGLLLLLLLAFLIAVIVLAIKNSEHERRWADGTNPGHVQVLPPYCESHECVASASALQLNTAVKPCDDFYGFMCDRWTADHPASHTYPIWNYRTMIHDRAPYQTRDLLEREKHINDQLYMNQTRDYYRSCTDLKAVDQQNMSISYVWPVLDGDWLAQSDWENMVIESNLIYDQGLLVKVVPVSHGDPPRYIIQVGETPVILPTNNRADFVEYGVNLIHEFDGGVNRSAARDDMEDVFNFAVQLQQGISDGTERQRDDYSRRVKVKDIQATLQRGNINWEQLLLRANVDREDEILLVAPRYLQILDQLKGSYRTFVNYLMLGYTHSSMDTLAWRFRRHLDVFNEKLGIRTERPERWRYCLDDTKSIMGRQVAGMYAYQYQRSADVRDDVNDMIRSITDEYKKMIQGNFWMSGDTKKRAVDKLDNMNFNVGHIDGIMNDDIQHKSTYKGQIFNRTYQDNRDNVKRFNREIMWARYKQNTAVGEDYWYYPVGLGGYNYARNSLDLNSASMRPPMFEHGYFRAMNYGSLGSYIGREIIRAVDEEGRFHNNDGKRVASWWTVDSTDKFNKRKQCMVDQYNEYKVNGDDTFAENSADAGGIRQAYRAYRTWVNNNHNEQRLPGLHQYTPEQIFFMQYARSHCTSYTRQGQKDVNVNARYRVQGSLANFNEFGKAFKCEQGTTYYRSDSCSVWRPI